MNHGLIGLMAVAATCLGGGPVAADGPHWINDYAQARAAARAAGKPIFLVFRCER